GRIGPNSARASYLEDERPERSRFFHSGAYTPVASLEAAGEIVVQYTGGFKRLPCDRPARYVIQANQLVTIEATDVDRHWADRLQQELDEKQQRFGEKATIVDSWHGGAHPAAESRPDL